MLMEMKTLNNGVPIPQLGYGVWKIPDEEAEQVVGEAIQTGYRLIDTAMIYGNERGVGKAIAQSDVPREELFITTKVWNADQGYENTLRAFDESLEKLGLDYVDLYLIHWPTPKLDRKSTRLNSSHVAISYAVFCLKKKTDRRDNNTAKKSTT